jgi:dienelactone hydrolase
MDGYFAQALHQAGIATFRIGITGFSRGGIAAMFAADERLHSAALPGYPRFAAHVAYYPDCATQWETPAPTGAPVLLLLGGRDDFTLSSRCVQYAERLKAHGANILSPTFDGLDRALHPTLAASPHRSIAPWSISTSPSTASPRSPG